MVARKLKVTLRVALEVVRGGEVWGGLRRQIFPFRNGISKWEQRESHATLVGPRGDQAAAFSPFLDHA